MLNDKRGFIEWHRLIDVIRPVVSTDNPFPWHRQASDYRFHERSLHIPNSFPLEDLVRHDFLSNYPRNGFVGINGSTRLEMIWKETMPRRGSAIIRWEECIVVSSDWKCIQFQDEKVVNVITIHESVHRNCVNYLIDIDTHVLRVYMRE